MPTDHRKPLDFNATIGRVNHRADRSMSLLISTDFEVTERESRERFHDYAFTGARVILAPAGAAGDAEIVGEAGEPKGRPTESQELRRLIFIAWDNRGRPGGDSEQFYKREMARIRQQYIDEIES